MVYIVSGIIIVFCIVVILFAIRIYKENRKLGPKKGEFFDDDDDGWTLPR